MKRFVFERTRILLVYTVFTVCLFLVQTAHTMAQDVVIIVNKELKSSTILAGDIGNIFLGKKTTWATGEKIVFAICEDTAAREDFLRQYVSKSPSQYSNYWKSMVFTGKGSMPVSFKTKDEVTAFVSATPGAISFVPAPADASVKTITVQ